jgi:hypothetical protein
VEHTLLARIGRVDDVVRAVRFLVDDAPFMTGSVMRLDGGYPLGGEPVAPMPEGVLYTPAMGHTPPPLKTYAALVATMIFWGLSFVATKVALESIPTFTLVFIRFSLAALIFLLLRKGRKWPSFNAKTM